MSDVELDPQDLIRKLDKLQGRAAELRKVYARHIAELFRDTLKQVMISGELEFGVEDTKGRRDYKKRKKDMGGGTTDLLFTHQYVNSIDVFEDRGTPTKKHNLRKGREHNLNYPRFFIPCPPGNDGVYGYYVDVPNILHDPTPLDKFGKRLFEELKARKYNESEVAYQRRKIRSRKEYPKQLAITYKMGVPLRWLKRILEFGSQKRGIAPRYHWGRVTDAFQERYGEDYWGAFNETFAEQLMAEEEEGKL